MGVSVGIGCLVAAAVALAVGFLVAFELISAAAVGLPDWALTGLRAVLPAGAIVAIIWAVRYGIRCDCGAKGAARLFCMIPFVVGLAAFGAMVALSKRPRGY